MCYFLKSFSRVYLKLYTHLYYGGGGGGGDNDGGGGGGDGGGGGGWEAYR